MFMCELFMSCNLFRTFTSEILPSETNIKKAKLKSVRLRYCNGQTDESRGPQSDRRQDVAVVHRVDQKSQKKIIIGSN